MKKHKSVPCKMRAVVQSAGPGDVDSMSMGEVDVPLPKHRQVLIHVRCAALNRMDLLQRAGSYPVPAGASSILGVEVSGVIAAVAEECQAQWQIGQKVTALLQGGGYAEYSVCDERTVFPVLSEASSLSYAQLASIPEAFMTAYQLLFTVAQLKAGESVLLHAAASSVGQAAIQLAKRAGCFVVSTCRSVAKCSRCREVGADAALEVSSTVTFANEAIAANGNRPFHVVLDPVGSSYAHDTVASLGMDGRWVLYGLMGGAAIADPTFLKPLLARRISLLPSTLRGRDIVYKEKLVEALIGSHVLESIARGDIQVAVDAEFALEEVKEAHRMMAENRNIGKIVLRNDNFVEVL